jgi:hypothetical protein
MRRLLFCLGMIILFAACGNGEPQENMPDIPVPPVYIAEYPRPADALPANEPAEYPALPEADVPPFNEYFISLNFEPETRIIRGMGRVAYTNRNDIPLNELVFRVPLNAWNEDEAVTPYPPEFHDSIFRRGRSYGFMEISHVSQDNEALPFTREGTVLTIGLLRPLEPNETTQVHMQFEAYIPMIAHRSGANEQAVWAGAFLPVEAVFDANSRAWHTEPYYPVGTPFILDIASYTVEITTPLGYMAAGTGIKTETELDDQRVTTFTANMSRDFAFAISPYFQRATQLTPSGVEINLYHYSPYMPAERILNAAVEAMTFFEETIGAYPYPQLCIVETDMFRSGVHFSAVIFMDSSHLRTSAALTSLRSEIGRQWFSVIIGSNPIEEAWLNGGLAHFLHEGLLDRPRQLREMAERSHRDLSLSPVYNDNVRRIATRISSYESWMDYFRIQHRKAQIMFYALYREMGRENFKDLLREYYRQFAFRIATSADFIALAEEIHGSSLQNFFNYWLNTTELPELP